MTRVIAALAAALLLAAIPARAQGPAPRLPPVDTAVVALRLTDGSELVGRVVARDDSSVTVVGGQGVRTVVPLRALASWRPARGELTASGFRPADPNTTRLFFGPTGRTLRQGEGYFADYYLFFAMVGYGVSDAVTISAGTSLLPGASGQLLFFGPKVRVAHGRRLDASVGGMLFTTTSGGGQAGVVYGAVTLGNEDDALTLVGGLGEADGQWSAKPAFLIGGEHRLGRGAKLLGEVWAFPASDVLPAFGGVRFFGSKLAVDFGLVYPLGGSTEGFPFAPWVDFTVRF